MWVGIKGIPGKQAGEAGPRNSYLKSTQRQNGY